MKLKENSEVQIKKSWPKVEKGKNAGAQLQQKHVLSKGKLCKMEKGELNPPPDRQRRHLRFWKITLQSINLYYFHVKF